MSPQLHPNGFRISDRPVAASFAHPYSFQAVADQTLRDDACMMSSMSLGGAEGMWVRYWDEASTAAIIEFKVEEPVKLANTAPVVKEKKEKKKKGQLIQAMLSSLVLISRMQRRLLRPLWEHLHFRFPTNRLRSALKVV